MDGDRQLPALMQEQNVTPSASTLCSPGLRKLLIEGEDSAGACRIIALNKTLRAECVRVLPDLEAAKLPATREEILEVVVRKMPAYGVTAKSAAEWGITFESYFAALEGLPLYAVEDAFTRWDRGEGVKDIAAAGFPPRPPQVALLAVQAKRDIYSAVYRAKKALDHVEKTGVEWTPERKKAERAKMIELGYLKPDGTPNMDLTIKGMPRAPAPTRSPQQIADELRQHAQARHGGAPISRHHTAQPDDGVGDVV